MHAHFTPIFCLPETMCGKSSTQVLGRGKTPRVRMRGISKHSGKIGYVRNLSVACVVILRSTLRTTLLHADF